MVKKTKKDEIMVLEIKIIELEFIFKEHKIKYDNEIKKMKNILKKNNNNVKDDSFPKRPKTAYIYFHCEQIKDYKKDNPDEKINLKIMSKETSIKWKKLKENQDKYNLYKELEIKDKQRYKKEIIIYDNKKYGLD